MVVYPVGLWRVSRQIFRLAGAEFGRTDDSLRLLPDWIVAVVVVTVDIQAGPDHVLVRTLTATRQACPEANIRK